jgi:membrane-bound ClpP family serine protease
MFKGNSNKTMKDWLIVLVLLLDEVLVVALVLLVLWFFEITIPLSVAIVIALLLGGFVFLTHRVILPSFHKKKATGPEAMVGLEGRVTEILGPEGIVRLEGEYWKARSVDGEILADEDVEVVALNRLTLVVKRKSQ